MFQDEAGFRRINKPKYCWCSKGIRPDVPCHHIREYRYAYGAVEPVTGEHFFLVMPWCNTQCMNIFLEKLSEQYPDDELFLVCDGGCLAQVEDPDGPSEHHAAEYSALHPRNEPH